MRMRARQGWRGAAGLLAAFAALLAVPMQTPADPVTGFVLVDATGGAPDPDLAVIDEGAVLNVAAFPATRFSIRAEVAAGARVGSVHLLLTGPVTVDRTEWYRPYTLFGDDGGTDHVAGELPNGSYTLTATPYGPQPGELSAFTRRFTLTGDAVAITADVASVTEGAAARFTLTRDGDLTAAATVAVAVTEIGHVIAGAPPATVTFGAGATTAGLTVATVDDTVLDAAGAVTVRVGLDDAYRAKAGAGSATVTVQDDDVATQGDLRLVLGEQPSEGLLEVFLDGTWGTVCDDDFDRRDAFVACRQLGYAAATGTADADGSYRGPIWLDDLGCSGSESRLIDCSYRAPDCYHFEDVKLMCSDVAVPMISIAADASAVNEGEAATFSLNRTGNPAGALAVQVIVHSAGQAQSEPVTFTAGAAMAALTVATEDDLAAGDEVVTAAVGDEATTAFAYGPGSAPVATVTVVGDEPHDVDHERDQARNLGTLAPGTSGAHQDSLNGVSDADDYYLFTLSRSARVTLTLSGLDHDADLTLEHARGHLRYHSTAAGSADEAIDELLGAGDWYLLVAAREQGVNDYELRYAVATLDANEMVSSDATLSALTLSGVDLGSFAATTLAYAVDVDAELAVTTVAASAADGAVLAIEPPDADGTAAGHQVSLTNGGDTDVTVTVTAADGTTTQTYTVRVSRPWHPLVTGFVLVDANAAPWQGDLGPIADGAVLDLSAVESNWFSIRAQVRADAAAGSVHLLLTGAKQAGQREYHRPYALAGDDGRGSYHGVHLPNGSYRIRATPYAPTDQGGGSLPALTHDFTVTGSYDPGTEPITGFVLVDATGGAPDPDLATIGEGAVLNVAELTATRFSIRAEVPANALVGSMRMQLAGPATVDRTESSRLYTLYGDDGDGDYAGGELPNGSYTLTATPYTRAKRAGTALPAFSRSFTVTGDAVAITADAATVTEGSAARFTLTRTGDATADATVAVAVTETGHVIAGTAPATVTFEAGATTAGLTVATVDDTVAETDSLITAQVEPHAGYRAQAGAGSATVTVQDNEVDAAGDLRLVLGERPSEGLLEVFLDDRWGTVCDDQFDRRDATVACRQLGYAAATGIGDADGSYRGPIWLDDLDCSGSESRLIDCSYRAPDCYHFEDVALSCSAVALPAIAITADAASVDAGTAATFTLTRSGAGAGSLAVQVQIRDSGRTDSVPVTFAAGAATATLSVATEDGAATDDDRGVTATIQEQTEDTFTYVSGSPAFATVTVVSAAPPFQPQQLAPPVVTGFVLVDATGDAPDPDLAVITEGARLNIAAFAADRLSIRAEVEPGTPIDRVELQLTGAATAEQTEKIRPYALYGDDLAGDYEGAELPYGGYHIVATPYAPTDQGGGAMRASSRTFTLTGAAPVIISRGPFLVDEGATAVATLTATDADTAGAGLTWSLPAGAVGGADRDRFTLSAEGLLAFSEEQDYEAPADADADGTYQVTVRVSDGAATVTADLEVRLRDVAEAGQTEVVLWSATLTVADTGDALGYQAGADGAADTGELSDDGWSHRGHDFTVTALRYDLQARAVVLALSAAPADGDRLTLYVQGLHGDGLHGDGIALALADGGGPRFQWDQVDLDWTVGDRVAVRVTRQVAPSLTVADARVLEDAGVPLAFPVTLSPASAQTVTVDWATEDATATAGEDYTASSGTLTFAPGQTGRTIAVTVLDDARDEGEETLTLRLRNAAGAVLEDAEATGTIANSDAIPRAWLARFGRTAADHVLSAVGERLAASPAAGSQATIAGHRLSPAPVAAYERAAYERATAEHRSVELRELVARSSFELVAAAADHDAPGDESGRWTVWGRGAWSRFAGVDGALSLSGDVITGTLGADYEHGIVLAGLALAYSAGTGTYGHSSEDSGAVQSAVAGVHPYLRVALHERLAVWALFGYGPLGHLALGEDAAVTTGVGMLMGAVGARGTLLAAPHGGGFELAAEADGLLVRMSSGAAAGQLVATEADVMRWRLLLHSSYRALPLLGGVLTPTVEVGGRYDAGAAETGAGLLLGGGLRYAVPAWGLTLAAGGRGLLLHENGDFSEWGAGGSLRFDPDPPGRGLALRVAPAWGAAATGPARLRSLPDGSRPASYAADGLSPRLDAELSYGLGTFGEAGLLTPYAGVALAAGGRRAWRVGGRFSLPDSLDLSLEGSRSEPAGDHPDPEHVLMLRGTLRR